MGKKRQKVSIILPINKQIAEHVLLYASTFKTVNKYLASRYNRDKNYKVELKMSYGKNCPLNPCMCSVVHVVKV